MVAIIDYGVGNLFSLCCSFKAIGQEAVVTNDPETIARADRVLLPGVGAFEDAAKKLRDSGMDRVLKLEAAKGKPLMGICLGMQLLFEKSFEFGEHEGLGLLKGQVVPMEGVIPAKLKIPHIGWNVLDIKRDNCPIFKYARQGDYVYFVHSYYADGCVDSLAASTDYGAELTAAVWKDKIFGCPFHPEKSGRVGLDILCAFCEI